MILEIATLNIQPGQEVQFELAFAEAIRIIQSMKGYIAHDIQRGIEHPSRYVLQINWQTLEDHTVGFRESPQFQEWGKRVGHFFNGAPSVEHFHSPA